jgi:hypothetical protein
MSIKHFLLLLGIWTLMGSCTEREGQQESVTSIDEYYDVQTLLAANEETLRQMNVSLHKEASFAGEVEETQIRLDSAALVEELEVFRELDINKPVFSGRYKETRELVNGQRLISYEADDKEALNINFLKVYKEAASGKVQRIEALYSNRNILYNSTRQLSLQYGQVNGQMLPRYYTVEGVQNMIFTEPEEYRIKAEFMY